MKKRSPALTAAVVARHRQEPPTALDSRAGRDLPRDHRFQLATDLRIVLIERDRAAAAVIRGLLRDVGPSALELEHVTSIAAAVTTLQTRGWDVVLTALRLRDGDVLDVVREVRTLDESLPVIVMSERNDDPMLLAAIKAGAEDYIDTRLHDGALLLKAIRYAVERTYAARHLAYLANYDKLTGLANRELFRDRLQQAMIRAERSHRMVALLSLDIDRFKAVNDALGHGAGDELLVTMAYRLKACVRKMDAIARVGSDEFAVIIEDVEHKHDVELVCNKIIAALAEAIFVRGEEIYVTSSVGVTLYPEDATDVNDLLRNADIAMERAKTDGRGRSRRFTPDLNAASSETMQIETGLRHALTDDALFLCYQPQLSLQTGQVVGVEALLRWQHPRLGVVMPTRFIPLAEDNGLIVPIGEWVLRRACRDLRRWQELGYDEMTVAVNLSARQFRRGDFSAMVESVIEQTAADPNQLVFEITESVLIEDSDHSRVQLDALKAMGVMVYLDDFGTGYSSLSYLKRFCIDGLKIDRSFIHDIPGGPDEEAITRAIIALSRALRLSVIAEGVENEAQLELLIREGCDQVQGYFFSPPIPFDELVGSLPDGFAREALAAVTISPRASTILTPVALPEIESTKPKGS